MSYHVENQPITYNELPEKILMREDGWYGAYKYYGEPVVDYWYVRDPGTCHGSFHRSSDLSSGRVPIYHCKAMNKSIFVMRDATYCPLCGGRIEA